ncbi:hypothetical protein C8R44DRAFT_740420 [Mycena epipterygia]|nr:hypothetical protein C8R44DRAFT_740420 [Mycena epipterygia]
MANQRDGLAWLHEAMAWLAWLLGLSQGQGNTIMDCNDYIVECEPAEAGQAKLKLGGIQQDVGAVDKPAACRGRRWRGIYNQCVIVPVWKPIMKPNPLGDTPIAGSRWIHPPLTPIRGTETGKRGRIDQIGISANVANMQEVWELDMPANTKVRQG